MKKKILLCIAVAAVLMCIFAITVSAANMASYCSVKLTLTSGEEVTAYCKVSGDQFERDILYKDIDTDKGTYNWEDVVIFDCRDQIAVGGTPKVFAGVNCNPKAFNVKEVYLSDYYTYFKNTTFTSEWKSLETVYISSSVTSIKGFGGSPVKNVIIAENSQLITIDGDAFSGCTQLENIDISNCQYLTTIGANAFRSCTSLTTITFPESLQSIEYNGFYCAGLSGTIVIPNSVTNLAPGSLLATKIETLIIGDGPVKIGYNFLSSVGNTYLKNVYIPAEATISDTNTFYRSAGAVNFYIVGENCDALVTRLLEQQSNNSYTTFITADKVTESTGAGYGIIYTGYNRCEIFYDNIHEFDAESGVESCIVECTRCKMTVPSGGEHMYALTEEFAGGKFTSAGAVINSCTVCGNVESRIEIDVIIKCLGYSASEKGEGIAIGYVINKDAIALYEGATGNSFAYGVFAALKTAVGQDDIVNTQGAVCADISKYALAAFEIKVIGFDDTNKSLELAIGAYIAVTKGDSTEYTYVQNSAPLDGEKYSFDSFNSIIEILKQ